MSFDDELRERFEGTKPVSGDLDAGLRSLTQASARRAIVRRAAGAGAVVAILLAGVLAAFNLTSDDEPSQLDIADSTTTTSRTTTTTDSTDRSDTTSLEPVVPAVPELMETGIVTVDVEGVVRINGTVITTGVPEVAGDPGVDVSVRAADGARGRLLFETNTGVYFEGALWHKAADARVLDVVGPKLLNAIAFTIPGPNDPSGPVVGFDEWGEDGDRTLGLFPVADLASRVSHASFGPRAQQVLVTAEDPGARCSSLSVWDQSGALVDDHPINQLSRCFAGEIAAWSDAGLAVLARPTEGDAWTLQVLGADGTAATATFPGAFQPKHVDVHTDGGGRTSALILGTGEELLYVDVDAFLTHPLPSATVVGISNEQNLLSARLVSGLDQHAYRADLDGLLENSQPAAPEPGSRQRVWQVSGVGADDTLNARSGPGTEFDVVFDLASDARGVVSPGEDTESADGGTWIEVYNPIAGSEDPSGWVNVAFLDPADVSDTLPCLFNGPQDHYIGIDWRSSDTPSATSDAIAIDAIQSYRFGGCIRTVIRLGAEFAPADGPIAATGLPDDIVVIRGSPTRIDFGDSIIAANIDGSEARLDLGGGRTHSTFVTVDVPIGDDGTGSRRRLGGEVHGASGFVDVRFDPTTATIVIDVADVGPDRVEVGASEPLFDDGGIVILDTRVDAERFTISGLARPFEAVLDLSLRKNGQPVEAQFIGALDPSLDQVSEAAIMTTGWIDGWGRFEFTMRLDEDEVDGLILDFDPSGGAADDPTIVAVPLSDLTEFSQPPD